MVLSSNQTRNSLTVLWFIWSKPQKLCKKQTEPVNTFCLDLCPKDIINNPIYESILLTILYSLQEGKQYACDSNLILEDHQNVYGML